MSQLPPHFALRLACDRKDLSAAQAVRHRVFVQELGARGGELTTDRIEADRFDVHCDHLLLLDALKDNAVVGTTRIMTDAGAAAAGGFATEEEFDIGGLRASGLHLMEVGRTCVLPEYRGGQAMHRLWQGLARLVEERGIGLLFGVASFQGVDPDALSQPLSVLHRDHRAPGPMRPVSRTPVSMDRLPETGIDRRAAVLAMPALVKAYLRLGGMVGDGAFRDDAFGCLDVCMVVDTRVPGSRARALYGPQRG